MCSGHGCWPGPVVVVNIKCRSRDGEKGGSGRSEYVEMVVAVGQSW